MNRIPWKTVLTLAPYILGALWFVHLREWNTALWAGMAATWCGIYLLNQKTLYEYKEALEESFETNQKLINAIYKAKGWN